jgi:hypothetical protein
VGTLGSLLVLPLFAASLLSYMARDYARFPSLRPPLLAIDLRWTQPYAVPASLLGFLVLCCLGLVVARLVRLRDVWTDATFGLAAGLTAGVPLLALLVGPVISLGLGHAPVLPDLALLVEGYETTTPRPPPALEESPRKHPQDVLVERYPDLADVEEHDRAYYLLGKIAADMIDGAFLAIWASLFLSFGVGALLGIYQTVIAGVLVRRRGGLRACLVPYLEMVLPDAALIAIVVLVLVRGIVPDRTVWFLKRQAVELLPAAAWVVTAHLAVWREWSWQVRWLMWLPLAFAALSGYGAVWWSYPLLALVIAAGLRLVTRGKGERRGAAAPLDSGERSTVAG